MAFLVKEIPQLGKTNEVKTFVDKWNGGEDFINIDALIPEDGMEQSNQITSIVADGIPKALFMSLAKNQSQFTKSDAGPAEGALAIMSKEISYAKTVYGQAEINAVIKCLNESTQMGNYAREFEKPTDPCFGLA